MLEKAATFMFGFVTGGVTLYLFYLGKGGRWKRRKTSIHKRSRVVRVTIHERQDQILALEECFFTGIDNILNLSDDQLNALKRYLQQSLADGVNDLEDVRNLKDLLVRMRLTELITSRSYGRIAVILQNAGIDPTPINVHIGRLKDAVADLRDGYEPHDFQAGDFEFDGVIIHCEDDREAVVRFMNSAEDMLDVRNLSLCTMEEFNISRPKLEGLATVFSRARFVYVYASENLQQDDFTRLMSDMALTESLTDPNKKGRFIPIWATEMLVRIPQLQQFYGLKYYRCFQGQSLETFNIFQNHIKNGRAEIV